MLVGVLRGHGASVTCFDVLGNDLLVSADLDGCIKVWNLDTRRVVSEKQLTLEQQDLPLSIQHYGSLILIQLKSGRISRYRLDGFGLLEVDVVRSFKTFSFFRIPKPVMFDEHCFMLVPSAAKESIEIVCLDEQTLSIPIQTKETAGMCLCGQMVEYDGSLFVLCGYDNGTLHLYRVCGTTVEEELSIQVFPESIIDLCVCTDGGLWVVCGGALKALKQVRIGRDFSVEIIDSPISAGVSSISSSSDLIVVGGWDGRLSVYSSRTLALLGAGCEHTEAVNMIRMVNFANGIQSSVRPSLRYDQLAISSSKDCTLMLWSMIGTI